VHEALGTKAAKGRKEFSTMRRPPARPQDIDLPARAEGGFRASSAYGHRILDRSFHYWHHAAMSRPRAFDPETVRDRVAEVFTAHGYRGTSVAMLAEAAGLGKQSLYNAFGDKQALYLQSLDCMQARMAGARAVIDGAPTGRAAIEGFFDGIATLCSHPDPAVHTCVVSSGLLEGIDDDAIADDLRRKWQATFELLQSAVLRGQADGTVRRDLPAADLSHLLMTLMSGLRVTGRVVEGVGALQTTVRLGLKLLWPPP
jgi:TetR/AcrR family transcriptional repressor of nem operon